MIFFYEEIFLDSKNLFFIWKSKDSPAKGKIEFLPLALKLYSAQSLWRWLHGICEPFQGCIRGSVSILIRFQWQFQLFLPIETYKAQSNRIEILFWMRRVLIAQSYFEPWRGLWRIFNEISDSCGCLSVIFGNIWDLLGYFEIEVN